MSLLQNVMYYLLPGSLVCIIYLVIAEIIMSIKKEKISWWHRIILFILGVYLIIVFSATVSPIYGFSIGNPNWERTNLTLFEVFNTLSSNPLNFFGNIIMFVPFGCLIVLSSKKYQKIYFTILAGAKLSFLIEILQLFLSRGTDVDDILLNTLGTFCGYYIGKLILIARPSIQFKVGILMKKNGRFRKNDTHIINFLILILLLTVITTGFFELRHYFN